MTSIPFGIDKPAPADQAGYPPGTPRTLADVQYVVYHDAQGFRGYLEAGYRITNDPKRRASWSCSVLTDGALWKHFPVEAAALTSGTKEANVHGFAMEFESLPDLASPITDAQVQTGALVYQFLRTVCPNLGPPALGKGFEEHRRLSNVTTCPNDRIRWGDIAALVEAPMTDKVIILKKQTGPGAGKKAIFSGVTGRALNVSQAMLDAYEEIGFEIDQRNISDAGWNALVS